MRRLGAFEACLADSGPPPCLSCSHERLHVGQVNTNRAYLAVYLDPVLNERVTQHWVRGTNNKIGAALSTTACPTWRFMRPQSNVWSFMHVY